MRRIPSALARRLCRVAGLGLAAASPEAPPIGAPAPEIKLTTLDGKPFVLSEAPRQNAVVVIFIATKCPYSNAYNDRMQDMAIAYRSIRRPLRRHQQQQERAGRGDGLPRQAARLHVPAHEGPGNKVADLYDAKHTPEVFVVDKTGSCAITAGSTKTTRTRRKSLAGPEGRARLLITNKPVARAETKPRVLDQRV